jgi:hypothetical protein
MEGTNVHNGITIQIKCDMALFSMHVHYVVHQINLVVKILSLVDNIKKLFVRGCYSYFFPFRKKAFELETLATLLNMKALKIHSNVKMSWLSILFPIKWVLGKYKPLVM